MNNNAANLIECFKLAIIKLVAWGILLFMAVFSSTGSW